VPTTGHLLYHRPPGFLGEVVLFAGSSATVKGLACAGRAIALAVFEDVRLVGGEAQHLLQMLIKLAPVKYSPDPTCGDAGKCPAPSVVSPTAGHSLSRQVLMDDAMKQQMLQRLYTLINVSAILLPIERRRVGSELGGPAPHLTAAEMLQLRISQVELDLLDCNSDRYLSEIRWLLKAY